MKNTLEFRNYYGGRLVFTNSYKRRTGLSTLPQGIATLPFVLLPKFGSPGPYLDSLSVFGAKLLESLHGLPVCIFHKQPSIIQCTSFYLK